MKFPSKFVILSATNLAVGLSIQRDITVPLVPSLTNVSQRDIGFKTQFFVAFKFIVFGSRYFGPRLATSTLSLAFSMTLMSQSIPSVTILGAFD